MLRADVVVVGIGALPAGLDGEADGDRLGRADDPARRVCLRGRGGLGQSESRPRADRALDKRSRAGPRGRTHAIAGDPSPFDETPYFSSNQFGLRLQHVGHAARSACRGDRRRGRLLHGALRRRAGPPARGAYCEPARGNGIAAAGAGGGMSRVFVAIAIAVAAAGIALLLNVSLLTDATPRQDPVGRLSPNSALLRVRPAAPVRTAPLATKNCQTTEVVRHSAARLLLSGGGSLSPRPGSCID